MKESVKRFFAVFRDEIDEVARAEGRAEERVKAEKALKAERAKARAQQSAALRNLKEQLKLSLEQAAAILNISVDEAKAL